MNRRLVSLLAAAVGASALIANVSCRRHAAPAPTVAPARAAAADTVAPAALPEAPAEVSGPFFVGLSSLDVEANERAGRAFDELSRALPREPAVWANLGIARLRLGDAAGADEALAMAEKLVPQNPQVILLRATLDEDQGNFAHAIERLQSLSQPDAAALYHLAELLGRTGRGADLAAQRALFDRLQQLRPANPVIAFGRARLLARMEDKPGLEQALAGLGAPQDGWSDAEVHQFAAVKSAVTAANFRAAGTALTFLQNLRQPAPEYQAAMRELGLGGGSIGHPIREFLSYRQPSVVVSPADEALSFNLSPDTAATTPADLFLAVDLGGKRNATFVSGAKESLRFAGGDMPPLPIEGALHGRAAVCAADINNDFLPDLAVASEAGLTLWMQGEDGRFSRWQEPAELRAIFSQPAHGVSALDYDADGDLDLLVARDRAAPQLLRNNGDGSFTALDTFAGFPELHEACWGDFDGDGDDDLVFLDAAGRVLVSWNERAGVFTKPTPVFEQPAVAIAGGDIAGTGQMSVLVLDRDGAIHGARFERDAHVWRQRELARWANHPDLAAAFGSQRTSLFIADLDNNGAPDLVASAGSASAIWLNRGQETFQPLAGAPPMFVSSITDSDGDGTLDLIGSHGDGAGTIAHGHSPKRYHWQSIQTRTLGAHADSRINTFGLGGRIEIRAGPLLTMAPITAARTHFGLGTQPQIDLARIVWPNGVAQVEFELHPDQEVTATQRLKGSCPWVFTRVDGRFQFVKDFIWRSPLGMRINSQDTAGVDQTEDWILIPGSALTAADGTYEVRITAELWETHFFDHVALQVVDHPTDVAAQVDERFVPTHPPKLAVVATSPVKPFAMARDQAGRDVLPILAAADGACVNDFPLGQYQGIAQDHWVEFQLPADAPADRPVVLVGEGWIYPTDSSLNVAVSQGHTAPPHGLVLETRDAQGSWQLVSDGLGFPAGKNKTVVIPVPDAALRAGDRHFRLRTNLEIYWDRLGWAVSEPAARLELHAAETATAELRHRGFSRLGTPQRRQIDAPTNYEALAGTGPRWRDLEGYYTRYGDVRELLRQTDDRYVIMNAGDEMVLRFAALPPPRSGWTRDFVLIGDGWVKDGDFNTANSRTVGPLPSHAVHQYGGPERPLTDDPVFQAHREDWANYHTRYVTPWAFEQGLMAGVPQRKE